MEEVAEAIIALKRVDGSLGVAAFVGDLGEIVWVVSGCNGENLIRAEGATQDEAWRRAVEQAGELGMLRRLPGTAKASTIKASTATPIPNCLAVFIEDDSFPARLGRRRLSRVQHEPVGRPRPGRISGHPYALPVMRGG